MTLITIEQRSGGHYHDVQLDDTFDFINTLENDANDGTPNEHLPTAERAIEWFATRGLIHAESLETTGKDLDRIRTVRAALREVADAVVERRAPKRGALDRVNRTLRARSATELVAGPDGIGIGHRHVGDPIDDALARVTEPLVQELASGNPDRLRVCANDMCRWVFYDESRAGQRRWCDMASCGNRAKAARHRARQKAAQAESAEASS
jgi:predicted RNA-binding Zn ribbon-like protein